MDCCPGVNGTYLAENVFGGASNTILLAESFISPSALRAFVEEVEGGEGVALTPVEVLQHTLRREDEDTLKLVARTDRAETV